MAKFLIRAVDHWMDSVPPNVRNQWPQHKKDTYDRRIQRGDVVVIKDSSHVWGSSEGLPGFVQADVTDMSLEDALAYMVPVFGTPDVEGNAKKLHRKRYQLKKQWVDNIIAQSNGIIDVLTADIQQHILDKL